ncbi:hypothetical protein DL98DRAFT_521914 [Cadophora sp. DSE1049]|nr:hypothetical protein DL98DRAFT_521914 [Cadophora sp. DSE1049]
MTIPPSHKRPIPTDEPPMYPYIRDLRRSGNAPEKILEYYQMIVGFLQKARGPNSGPREKLEGKELKTGMTVYQYPSCNATSSFFSWAQERVKGTAANWYISQASFCGQGKGAILPPPEAVRAYRIGQDIQILVEATRQLKKMLSGMEYCDFAAPEILAQLSRRDKVLLSCTTVVVGQDFATLADFQDSGDCAKEEREHFCLKFSSFVRGSWTMGDILAIGEEFFKDLADKIKVWQQPAACCTKDFGDYSQISKDLVHKHEHRLYRMPYNVYICKKLRRSSLSPLIRDGIIALLLTFEEVTISLFDYCQLVVVIPSEY